MSDRVVVDRVCAAIFAELDRQHEAEEIGGHGYWDSEWGCLDGEPKWGKVAEAAIGAVASARPDEVSDDPRHAVPDADARIVKALGLIDVWLHDESVHDNQYQRWTWQHVREIRAALEGER